MGRHHQLSPPCIGSPAGLTTRCSRPRPRSLILGGDALAAVAVCSRLDSINMATESGRFLNGFHNPCAERGAFWRNNSLAPADLPAGTLLYCHGSSGH